MTTEEKARAYDEALNWIRELHPRFPGAFKEEVEHYFPGLRESEDERNDRMRGRVIESLVCYRGKVYDEGDKEVALLVDEEIAWMKKQKEQKPVEYLDKDKIYAIMTKLTNLSYSQLLPINSDEYKKIHEITSDVRSLLDCPIEQKPVEWSGPKFKPGMENVLKSLRPCPSWKPSEEQMEALRMAVHKLANTDVADSVRLSIMYDNLKKL